jgi:hypothetical protein
MKKILVVSLLVMMLLPTSSVFAQVTNTPSTLGVKLTNTTPFSYKNEDGYTVVIGEVENTKSHGVQNVKIWVGFYSGKATGSAGESPLETTTGSTLIEVIPPKGKSPFIITSQTPDEEISEVKVSIRGFDSVTAKPQSLEITPDTLSIGETIKLDAKVKNSGQTDSTNTKIHLIAFDAFNPPRIVGIQTVDASDIAKSQTIKIEFDAKMDYRASSFKVVAESDNYQSKTTDVKEVSLDAPTRLVSINSVEVQDSSGNRISQLKVGKPVNITSELSIQYFALTNPKQNYVYYAQVKEFGEKATVEFLGFTEGEFDSAEPQTATISWTPEHEGGFFIEAYVWDPDGVALAAPSKTISIVLVTP